jgi:tetratricopeptide (TPR) repeat protein
MIKKLAVLAAEFTEKAASKPLTYLLMPNTGAMLRLAFGSATAIASLMSIPDAIGILPVVPDTQTWIIRMIGNWLAAFILWFVGFSGVLFFARIASGGIELTPKGLKFWRFGKTIQWKNIRAISVEAQPAFSLAFCLPTPARQLLIYEEKPKDPLDMAKDLLQFKKKDHDHETKLVTHPVPSFQFSEGEFESFYAHVCERAMNFVPNAIDSYIFAPGQEKTLRETCEHAAFLRKILAVIIILSMFTVIGRRASTSYLANRGNTYLVQGNYVAAKKDFLLSTKIDPTFAVGWDQLARTEYRSGDLKAAETHWMWAAFLKPNLIDAKVGLSSALINRGDYKQAKELLLQGADFLPDDCSIKLNLAEAYNKSGDKSAANKLLAVIQRDACFKPELLARAALIYLEMKDFKNAEYVAKRVLSTVPGNRIANCVIESIEKGKA